jgi:hypothetical protein
MKFLGFAGIRFRKLPSFPSLSCFALTSLALCSLPVFAQTNQGAIAGNVQDVTGSVIGGPDSLPLKKTGRPPAASAPIPSRLQPCSMETSVLISQRLP